MCVLHTTCSTVAPLLMMMASLKSGRSDGKKCNCKHMYTHACEITEMNEGKCERTSSFLCINANQSQVFPQRLQKVIQVQLHPTT